MNNDRGYDPDELERAWRRECEKRCELEDRERKLRARVQELEAQVAALSKAGT